MGKRIECPVKKWPGSVVLVDPMGFEQYLKWKQTINAAHELVKDEKVPWDEYDAAVSPGIIACVEKWELEGLPEKPETLPATPRLASHKLIHWLIGEITALITEDETVPLA